jgi:hypothetical protein
MYLKIMCVQVTYQLRQLKFQFYYLVATLIESFEVHGNGHGMMMMMMMMMIMMMIMVTTMTRTVMTTVVLTPLCTFDCYTCTELKSRYVRLNIATGRTGYKWKSAATLNPWLAWDCCILFISMICMQ